MNILFLSRWLPYPADNGSKIRIMNLLRNLSERHRVSLLTFAGQDEAQRQGGISALHEVCDNVRVLGYREFRPGSARAVAGLLSRRPRFLVDTFQHRMRQAVEDEVARQRPDVIVVSQLDMAPYALVVPTVPALLEELELTTFDEQRSHVNGRLAAARATLTWVKLVAYLRRVLPRFAACTVASELERERLQRAVPRYRPVHVVPNALDMSRYEGVFGIAEPDRLVYTGSLTYDANFDAVSYFARDILPTVADMQPRVTLHVTGHTGGVDLASLPNSSHLKLDGYIDDIRPTIARSWASVVPLRKGGGTRLKVLEAMALGTPVVSTSKGAEGLNVRDGEHLLLADSSSTFAAKLVELMRSPELRSRLIQGGRRLVASKYDARDAGRQLCTLVESVALNERVA